MSLNYQKPGLAHRSFVKASLAESLLLVQDLLRNSLDDDMVIYYAFQLTYWWLNKMCV